MRKIEQKEHNYRPKQLYKKYVQYKKFSFNKLGQNI